MRCGSVARGVLLAAATHGWSRSGRHVSDEQQRLAVSVSAAAARAAAATWRRPSAGPRSRPTTGPSSARRASSARTTSNVRYCSASGESSASAGVGLGLERRARAAPPGTGRSRAPRSPNSRVELPAERDADAQLRLVGADAEPRAQEVAERPVRDATRRSDTQRPSIHRARPRAAGSPSEASSGARRAAASCRCRARR